MVQVTEGRNTGNNTYDKKLHVLDEGFAISYPNIDWSVHDWNSDQLTPEDWLGEYFYYNVDDTSSYTGISNYQIIKNEEIYWSNGIDTILINDNTNYKEHLHCIMIFFFVYPT